MPGRVRDLNRVLFAYGIWYETAPGGGSHARYKNGTDTYPVPASNGERTELDDVYIRACCRKFGLDFKEIKKKM